MKDDDFTLGETLEALNDLGVLGSFGLGYIWFKLAVETYRAKTEQGFSFPYIIFSLSPFEVFAPKLKYQARKSKLGGYRLSSSTKEDSKPAGGKKLSMNFKCYSVFLLVFSL